LKYRGRIFTKHCTPVPATVAAIGLLAWGAAELRDRRVERHELEGRLDRLASGAPGTVVGAAGVPAGERLAQLSPLTASWRSVAGCGAGSSTGVGGIKWVGRNVTGGLVNVQCQANYTKLSDGYVYAVQNQISADLGERWNVGVVVPYLYKYMVDPFGLRFDLSNQGIGDVNLLLSRRLGPIRATTVTVSVGIPTGNERAEYLSNVLRQDRQLGSGQTSGGLMIDHVLDNIWGPAVLGGTVVYPGKENDLENFRAPFASVYGYVGYLLGPLVPSLGISATNYFGQDRDRGLPSDERPPWMVSANGSLEWSTDWVALLAGVSLPYHVSGLQPWTVGFGLALSPF
jgi:hypothetical protein